MTHPSGLGPRPPVCACEPTIREGLLAAARLVGIDPSKFRYASFGAADGPEPCIHGYRRGLPCPACDRQALMRAVLLASDPRPILTDECLAPQILQRDAAIRGLTERLASMRLELRRVEWALERSLSDETKSPSAAAVETEDTAMLRGCGRGGRE